MSWYFLTYDEFDRTTLPQHNTTNITTMVVETLDPPVAWIQRIHTTQGVGDLAHILSKAAVKGFYLIQ
jgi:hypothetical protein